MLVTFYKKNSFTKKSPGNRQQLNFVSELERCMINIWVRLTFVDFVSKVTPELLTTSVGKGKVKSNAKGKEKSGDLTVAEGDEVDIIRMIDNPAGKWLVRILSSQKGETKSYLINFPDFRKLRFKLKILSYVSL